MQKKRGKTPSFIHLCVFAFIKKCAKGGQRTLNALQRHAISDTDIARNTEIVARNNEKFVLFGTLTKRSSVLARRANEQVESTVGVDTLVAVIAKCIVKQIAIFSVGVNVHTDVDRARD